MSDDRLRRLYARAVARRGRAARPACVAPERLADLVERRGPEDERLRTLDHVMQCATCQEELELLRALAAADRPVRRRGWPLALAASLALVVAGGALWFVLERGQDVLRGPRSDVTVRGPRGTVDDAAARALAWRPVVDATLYRIELLGPAGEVVFAAETAESTATVPPGIPLVPNVDYRWWVRAQLVDGGERRSALTPFRVRGS